MRPDKSVPAPAANGIISFTGRAGYSSAAALCAQKPISANSPMTRVRIGLVPMRKAETHARQRVRPVAGHVGDPVQIEVLDRACRRDPVSDLGRAADQLVER